MSENVGDRVGVDGDQADSAFACERGEPLDHAAGGQARSLCAAGFNCDQVSILRVGGCAWRDRPFLAKQLLVDRLQSSGAMWTLAENTENAGLGMIGDIQ